MRAIEVARFGGPEVLTPVELPAPEPGPGELLVRTDAVGVNYIDTYFRTGLYPRELPYIPGSEGTGRVVAVGEGVGGVAVGDRVSWAAADGSYAEQVLVPAAVAVPVPDAVPAEQAASALLQGMTAHYLLNSTYPAQPGETVLVHAGAGGVGLLLTQLAAAKDVRVITTVSSDEKETLSRGAGAAEVLRYTDDLAEQVRDLTGGEGVAAVYDGVGAASGPVPPFDLQRLNPAGSLYVTRPTLAHHVRTREELMWRAGEVFAAVADGTLTVRVGARYPLAQAEQAHRDLEARRTTGSIVLLP